MSNVKIQISKVDLDKSRKYVYYKYSEKTVIGGVL
jgi:hypothetical protein